MPIGERAVSAGSRPEGAGTAQNKVAELLHDAGLTAGGTIGLRPGRIPIGPHRSSAAGLTIGDPDTVSFDLVVGAEGAVTLHAGREPVAVDGVVVDRPVHLQHGDVVQLRTDHFVLRWMGEPSPPRATELITPRTVPPTEQPSLPLWFWLFAALTCAGFILGFLRSSLFGLALIGLGGIIATLVIRSHQHDQALRGRATQVSNARSLLFSQIVNCRKALAEALRSEASTPTTIARRASTTQAVSDPHLSATVASGDRSWEPPVVTHRDPGWDHQAVVDELSFLPAIPFTVDLDAGPIAIVGPRLAVLSVARHIATTALVTCRPHTGISVETVVPADWRWLPVAETPTLRIFDGTGGDRQPRTVVLAPSIEALDAPQSFQHVVQIHEDGRASIFQADGGTGSGFVPHGITEKQARRLVELTGVSPSALTFESTKQRTIGLRQPEHDALDSKRLLVTGTDRSRTKNVLATAALRQASRFPDRSIFILDRGDRALIRLAQLQACQRYVAIDQIANVDFMIAELEALEARSHDHRVLFLAPDLWEATAFYRNSGRSDLADRIDRIVSRMEVLPIAASATDLHRVPRSSFLVWVNTDGDALAEVHLYGTSDHQTHGTQFLDLDALPGIDLTASVARFAPPLEPELLK